MNRDFEDTPLGDFASRHGRRPDFIDKFNNFLIWSKHQDLWKAAGKPNPFDDGDVSTVEFMKVQMGTSD